MGRRQPSAFRSGFSCCWQAAPYSSRGRLAAADRRTMSHTHSVWRSWATRCWSWLWWPLSWSQPSSPEWSLPPTAAVMTGLVTICVGGLQTIPSRGVWADDTGRCVSDRRSFVRGGSLRGLVSAGCRHGDDGTGADDQWGVVGCRRVLVVPGPGPVWPGSAAGVIGGDDGGDGHGFGRGPAVPPPRPDTHDRCGSGACPMTGAPAALSAMMVLPAAGVWWFLCPDPSGQVLRLVILAVRTVEMAMGFAVATLLHRRGQTDMTDAAQELAR